MSLKESSCRWQAHRSASEWFGSILQSVGTIHDAGILSKFISCDSSESLGEATVNDDEPWLKEEQTRLRDYFTLLVELASARVWSQMVFATCPPYSVVAVLHDDHDTGQHVLNRCCNTWRAIVAAENAVKPGCQAEGLSKPMKKAISDRLVDVSFQTFQITREVMALCEACQWNMEHEEIQKLAYRMFGGPCETKFSLEDLFAHLVSVGKLASLATPMNK